MWKQSRPDLKGHNESFVSSVHNKLRKNLPLETLLAALYETNAVWIHGERAGTRDNVFKDYGLDLLRKHRL